MSNPFYNNRRTVHISHSFAQNHFPSLAKTASSAKVAYSYYARPARFTNAKRWWGFLCAQLAALVLMGLLLACAPPGSSGSSTGNGGKNPPQQAKCTSVEPQGAARFKLTKNADNTTYTLTIAECVQTITKGEFSSDNSSVDAAGTTVTLDSQLNGKLGANPKEAVTKIV